ncbi:MAG: iron-sulfur cluster assembly scaffold protein [Candidatus Cloacimonadota bacterium]|nr:MAG: iron-sulfur cluster assembly scaffold protein [Candidatus Cloacimonadota bacterium]
MQYSEKVLDHFMNPRNVGKLENPDAEATEGSPACGDQVTLYLKVNPESHIIEDIKFQSYGCASNIATGSIITEMAKGKSIIEARDISWKEAASELDGLPPQKMHCSVLAVDTLRRAIKNYEISHNLAEIEEFSKETIVDELKHVIYPKVGEDIVSLKMVKYVGYENGTATIDLEIPKFDTMRDNVVEEIHEHLEKYKEITEVKVNL